jgi:bud site selection protein 20
MMMEETNEIYSVDRMVLTPTLYIYLVVASRRLMIVGRGMGRVWGQKLDLNPDCSDKTFRDVRSSLFVMGQPQARKSRKHKNGNHPLHRTRNYGRDVDQIHGDLSEQQKTLLKNTVLDEEKPGLGKWYCVECAKWFIDQDTLKKHTGTKVHKRRYVLVSVY